MKYKFNIKEAFKQGWDLTKKHFWLMLGIGATVVVMNMAVSWVPIVSTLVSLWTGFNIYKITIDLVEDKSVEFTDIFKWNKTIFRWTGAQILFGLAYLQILIPIAVWGVFQFLSSTTGTISFTSDSFGVATTSIFTTALSFVWLMVAYYSIRYMFGPMLILDKNMGIKAAFKRSYEMTKGEFWHLVGMGILSAIVILIGLIALLVGVIPAIMIVAFANMLVYKKLESHVNAA